MQKFILEEREADKRNNHSKNDHDQEVILKFSWQPGEHCDEMIWLLKVSLECKISKANPAAPVAVWLRIICCCFTYFTKNWSPATPVIY